MKINFENLEAVMGDFFYCTEDYYHSSSRYYREHGYGVNIDHAKTAEEKHIMWAYHNKEKAYNAYFAIASVFCDDEDSRDRLFSAFRSVNKWYEKNQWRDCLNSETKDKIIRYIFG